MSPTARRRRTAPAPDPFPERGLAELGLAPGDQVRFRRNDSERWKPATVARRERDGSVGLHDPKGASRAIPVACIEVRDTGPRGGVVWESLSVRAARTEQMALVSASSPSSLRRRRTRSAAPADEPDTTDPPDPSGQAHEPTATADDAPGDDGRDGQLRLL